MKAGRRSERPARRPAAARPRAGATENAAKGTQAIERSIAVLRAIALRGRGGLRLADIARQTRLERPTVHRMLKCLCAEGILAQDADSRRYLLGPLLFELGLAATPQFSLRELCQATLTRIAERSGDTVFLSVRSGNDSVCIDRREGSFPIKALLLDIGTRRPLGAGASGIALLLPLAEETAAQIIEDNAARLLAYGNLSPSLLLDMLQRARKMGYALNDLMITPGAVSIGLPIKSRFGEPFAAIAIGAIESRMTPERQAELVIILREETALLEKTVLEKSAA